MRALSFSVMMLVLALVSAMASSCALVDNTGRSGGADTQVSSDQGDNAANPDGGVMGAGAGLDTNLSSTDFVEMMKAMDHSTASEQPLLPAGGSSSDVFCSNAPPMPFYQHPELHSVLYEDPTAGLGASMVDTDGFARGGGMRLVTETGSFESFWNDQDPEKDSVGFRTTWVDQMDLVSRYGAFFLVNHGTTPLCAFMLVWHGGDKLPYAAWYDRLNWVIMPGDEVLVGVFERLGGGMNR
jgi:hypothetical protein